MRSRRHSLDGDHQHEGADQHRGDQQEHAAVDAAEEQDAHRDRRDDHEGAHVGLGQQQQADQRDRATPSASPRGGSSPSRPSCAPCSWRHTSPSPAWPARDGWKFMMPSGIQRRAPLTPLPMNGTSTSTSSTSATTNTTAPHFSQKAIGTCTTTMPASDGDGQRQQVADQEMGVLVAREARVVGQRDRCADRPSPARGRAAPARPRPASGRSRAASAAGRGRPGPSRGSAPRHCRRRDVASRPKPIA